MGLSLSRTITLGKARGLSSTAQSLGLMLGWRSASTTPCSSSPLREERARGREPHEAAGSAASTAGSAVVFAGLTVIIALAGLPVIGIPRQPRWGWSAAATVAVAVLAAVTLPVP